MGHSDVQTTMNIYNEIQEAKKKEAFTELNNKIMISWQLNQSTKKGRFEHRPFAVSLKPIWSELNSVFQRFLKAEILRYTVTFVSPAASLSGIKFCSLHPAPCRSVRIQNSHNTWFVKFFHSSCVLLCRPFLLKGCRASVMAYRWHRNSSILLCYPRMLYLPWSLRKERRVRCIVDVYIII